MDTSQTAIIVLAVVVVLVLCGICTAVVVIALRYRRAKVLQKKRYVCIL